MVDLGRAVLVRAPATTANLGPGFDALGMALDWYEEAECALSTDGWVVRVSGPGAGAVPRGPDNLAARGARAVLAAAGRPHAALRIALRLSVPVGRGLGSSAAAVAAGVVAADALLGAGLPPEELVRLATEVEGHPDNVAPAILGGLCASCVAAGGARVLSVRLPPPPGLEALAAIPDPVLRTAVARSVLPAAVPFADAVANVQRACLLVAGLAAGRTDVLAEATCDRLHQPYRAPLVPGLLGCLDAVRAAGAPGVFLSGAGPSILALVPAGPSPVGAAVEGILHDHLRAHGGGAVRRLGLAARGAHVVERRAPA